MSTSGTYSFTVTHDDIIRQALINIGKLDPLDTVSPVDHRDCAFQLNMLVKQFMGSTDRIPGLRVWTRRRGTLFLSNSGYRYSLGPTATGWAVDPTITQTTLTVASGATTVYCDADLAPLVGDHVGVELDDGSLFWSTVTGVGTGAISINDALPAQASSGNLLAWYTSAAQQPLKIEAAVLRDSNYSDSPINIMTQKTYDLLPDKTSPSNVADPTAIYYEFQLGNSSLYTDCGRATDVSKYMVLTYLEPVQDFTTALDNPEYPQECYRALVWALAKEISPMYSRPWTPLRESLYSNAMSIAGNKDPEISQEYFQPGNT